MRCQLCSLILDNYSTHLNRLFVFQTNMSDEKKFLRFKPAYDILLLREVVASQPENKQSWEEVIASARAWLPCRTAPSCVLSGCVDRLEVRYREVIDACIHGENVKAMLVASLVEAVNLTHIQCGTSQCHTCLSHTVWHLSHGVYRCSPGGQHPNHSLRENNRTLRDDKTVGIGRHWMCPTRRGVW